MQREEFKRLLSQEREHLRAQIGDGLASAAIASRVAVVLSGGGARGAYEAGALLALQDAKVPTHILAATSVGSINAGSFAGHSKNLVGNAEPLIEAWSEISPAELGIDWSRYIFMLAGLGAALAGAFNGSLDWFRARGIYLHSLHPVLTWIALMLAGAVLLLLYDELPYVVYVIANYARGGRWRPDRAKALRSLAANVFVWGFIYLALTFTHLHVGISVMPFEVSTKLLLVALMAMIATWWFFVRDRASFLSQKFLRLPLHTGLFPNYERTKFLRGRIPAADLLTSPMRVVMTATDLRAGSAKYFTNAAIAELLHDPGVTPSFVSGEMEQADDLLLAVIASSAYTIAYEAVRMRERLWTDGGIVTNQPIRPAVRLGADVLFLVMLEPVGGDATTPLETFLDVGLRALDILVTKNLLADLKNLDRTNRLCLQTGSRLHLAPEQVQLEIGSQSFRYVKAFTVCPQKPLALGALDFKPELTRAAIIEGYRDGARAALEFVAYERTLPQDRERRIVRLEPQTADRTKQAIATS